MKKIVVILVILLLSFSAYSQTVDISELENQFEEFSGDIAPALPSAAVMGTTWSDAYIGKVFPSMPPHLGAGAFVGAALFPLDAFESLLSVVDPSASLPSQITDLGAVPLPAFGVSVRMGGVFLPFDVGVKYAALPAEYSAVSNAVLDYSLVGADIRYALLKGGAVKPKLSVGLGFSRLSSSVSMQNILEGDYVILENPNTSEQLVLSNPDFQAGWTSTVLDATVQVSKSLLIFTPYAGAGISYANSDISGGISTSVKDETGTELTQEQIDSLIEDYESFTGEDIPAVDVDGFISSLAQKGFSPRVFLGTSINIFVMRLDVNASYNFSSSNFAAELGLRFQL